ncbi:uncharacterized protein LOC143660715 [Tamandua tetradactyla]|uniref:uncharacterized protein LOC143660715 n=1 Tax=Tamandua tetradactyla TaxID=48850 RepID=UPI004053B2B7
MDPTARGWLPCLRVLAAATTLTREALKLNLSSPLQVLSPHCLQNLLSHKSLYAHAFPPPGISFALPRKLDVTLSVSPSLNPATLPHSSLSNLSPQPTHLCTEIMEELTSPCQGLSDMPLSQADLTLFIDGSSIINQQGKHRASYALVSSTEILEAVWLPEGTTSQKAELIALTRALHLAKSKSANIYTDSKYAFQVAHCHSAIWKEPGFLTTKGSPVINAKLIQCLFQALQLPSQVTIIHCKGHQTDKSDITHGNNWADAVARELTKEPSPLNPPASTLFFTLPSLQPAYSFREHENLLAWGSSTTPEGWIFLDNKVALPTKQAPDVLSQQASLLVPCAEGNQLPCCEDTQWRSPPGEAPRPPTIRQGERTILEISSSRNQAFRQPKRSNTEKKEKAGISKTSQSQILRIGQATEKKNCSLV